MRFYDPTIGRFIQPDTIISSHANAQTLNRFSYVGNDPVMLVDPSGNFGKCSDGMTGYQCRIRLKQAGELEAQWEREKAQAALAGLMQQAQATADAASAGAPGSSGGALAYWPGYESWEEQILIRLIENGGPAAVHGVAYMISHDIHITVGEQHMCVPQKGPVCSGDWQTLGNVSGWYDLGANTVVLAPGSRVGVMPGDYALSIIVHEAYHLEQGEILAKSRLGEMQAGQIGFDVLTNLTQKDFDQLGGVYGDWLPKAAAARTPGEYWSAYWGNSYWVNLAILPCRPWQAYSCGR